MNPQSIAAALTLAALVGLPGAAAGAFGASLSPATLVFERETAVVITNKSDTRIVATLEVDPPGWTLEETELTLAVGERRSVEVTQAGRDDAILRVTVHPDVAVAATDTVAVVLEGKLRHETWLESLDPRLAAATVGGPVLLLVLVVGVLAWRRSVLSSRRRRSRSTPGPEAPAH